MTTRFIFENNDSKIINQLEKQFSKEAKFILTLNNSIDTWERLVNECKSIYGDLFEEYANDLFSRTIIKKIYDSLSINGREKLLKIVQPLDEIFLKNTININKPVLDYDDISKDTHFWFYRIPKRIDKNEIENFKHLLTDKTLKKLS